MQQSAGGPAVSVSLNQQNVTLTPPATAQFLGTVNGAADASVTWTVSAALGGAAGSIPAGLYTPPASVAAPQLVKVTATSNADPSESASATVNLLPNAAPPAGFTPIRVRAGWPAYTDPQGQVWAADTGYSGGNPFTTGADITLTATPPLYQSERWSLTPFQYQFAVPGGFYHVKLKFSENYASAPGQRVFNVSINKPSGADEFRHLRGRRRRF